VDWSASVRITDPGDVVVEVPNLQVVPPALPALGHEESAPAPRSPFVWTAPRVAGTALVGAGAVALGVAGALALAARGKENQADGETSTPRINDSASAVQEGNVATGFLIAGGVLVVAGIVLWIAVPASRSPLKAGGSHPVFEGTF
jgi:hypothetical protein